MKSFTAQILRTLLATAVVCCWTTQVRPQTENKSSGATVRGTVVYSDTDRPLRNAGVTLIAVESGSRWQASTGTDLRGQFVFADVPAGKYLLTLDAPGLIKPESNKPRVETLVSRPWFPEKSELVTEVTVNGTDTVNLKMKAVRGGVITGRVVTEDDQPLINADVKLLWRENGKWVPVWATWSIDRQKPERRTDGNGVYRIAGLRSGEYLVRASEPLVVDDMVPGDDDAYSDGSFMVAYHPAATRLKDARAVQVEVGKESTGVDIRMTERASHTLMGTVTFQAEKEARTHITLMVERSDEIGFATALRNATTRVDEDGKWRVTGLPAGEYLVTIEGSVLSIEEERGVEYLEALPKRTTVRIGDEKVTLLNTTLTLGAQVRGRVTLNGKPPDREWSLTPAVDLAGKPVVSNSAPNEPDQSSFHTALPLRDGTFAITALPPGTYWFRMQATEKEKFYVKSATRKGVDLMQAPFKLTEDFVFDDVVVKLSTDLARVEARVVMPEGAAKEALNDLTVIVAPADEATRRFNVGSRELPADDKGNIIFSSPPGEYLIAAITTAEYNNIQSEISNEYFEKNAEKFLRIKLRAGETTKGLLVPMMGK